MRAHRPAAGATDAATASALRSISTGPIGKVPAEAVRIAPAAAESGIRTTKSAADGSFAFSGITSPGYYLLTLAKPGFATQRFVIDAATLDAATPIKVALVPGNGSLSGSVTSAAGAVGAASVTITDGTVALQTSTVSKSTTGAKKGSWTVNGLSTPGTYLVTVDATGFGSASSLVTLAAGGTGKIDLSLKTGVAAINGLVSGIDGLGHLGGLGGITVTASGTSKGVAASRTATTVTSGPIGSFGLPDLPTPGTYTVTVSGPGYASQTRQVSLAEGSSSATVNVSLTKAYGTVSGLVVGDGKEGGLIGAGLTLTGSEVSYKTMTTSAPAGAFRFTGVPPGTYVLQASQYGRRPSSATVVVTAAASTTVNLHLVGAADTELPDTSRIRGRAVDSRTQGPVNCDRSPTAVAPKNCLVTASTLVPLVPSKGTAGGTEPIKAISDGAGNYTLPGVGDKKHPGLVAGLYQVTLAAPGYEPTTITVQVAQGQTVPAPQVSLSPLGLITGTITTHVGTPVTPSCVVAVPADVATPTTCAPNAEMTSCVVTGSPLARCSLTGTGGSYEIRGLVHGGYKVIVLPTDKEYQRSQALAVQLDLGGDFRFDTALDRLGRAAVTVLQANPLSLALSAAKGAAVQIVDSANVGHGNPLPGDSTSDDGILTITGLLGSFTALASGQVSTGGTELTPGKGSAPTGVIALNQTVALTIVITAPIGAVVGHVTVAVDGTTQDVPNAVVQVTGIVGFNGRNSVSGTVSVTTDSNGCYAIIPADWSGKFPLKSADCPTSVTGRSVVTIQGSSGSQQSLVALPLSINVAQLGQKTQSYSATGVVITGTGEVRVIPPINLLAQPSAVPVLTLTLKAPSGIDTDASKANIVVTRKPAGAGNITVTAAPNGTLTWTDSNLGTGKAVPGLYRLTSTELGYATLPATGAADGMASGTASVWCGLGVPCRFGTQGTAATEWTQSLLAGISGKITAPDLPLGVKLSNAVVTVSSKPTAAGSISVSVSDTGAVTFQDLALQVSGLPGNLAQPTAVGAPYLFTVSLPGYSSGAISVSCGATYVAGCDPLSATLVPLPRFNGSVKTVSTIRPTVPDNDFAGVTVSFSAQPNPAQSVALTVNSDGSLTWSDPNQPQNVISYGDYTMTFAKPGYESVTQSFSCPTGALTCPFNANNPVTIKMFAAGAGTVAVDALLPGTTSVDWSKATVTLTNRAPGSEALGITVARDLNPALPLVGDFVWKDSGLPYDGITRSGTYALTVTLPGYGAGSSSSFTCAAGATGATACGPPVVALGRLPGFAGTVKTQATVTPDNTGGLVGVTATVTAQPNPSATISVAINTTSGALTWADSTQPAGIVSPGSYTILFAKDGFQSLSSSFTCSAGTCGPGTVTLLEFPQGTGVVSVDSLLPGTSTVDWSKATVSLSTQAPGSGGLSIGLASSGATTAKLTWRDSSLPDTGVAGVGITRPGTYVIVVSLPGFGTKSSTPFTCSAGDVTCEPSPALVLGRLPGVTGSVTITPTIDTTPAQGLDGITVAVNSQPNPTNPVVVSVDATTGTIKWNDPTQPAGVVTAGTYSLTFAKPGYQPVSTQFTCASGSSSCDIGTIALLMNPHGTGSVTVSALAPGATSVDWTKATVTLVNQPPNTPGLGVSLVPGSGLSADFRWVDSAQPYTGITLPGNYSIRVALPGYGTQTSAAFTCAAGDKTCGPDLTLSQQPSFSGTVATNPAGGSLVGAVVSVTSPAGVNAVTATLAATAADPTNGAISWQEAGAPAGLVSPGTYQVSVAMAGYLSQSLVWTCNAQTCPPLSLVLTAPSTLQITVNDHSDDSPVNGATFDLSGTLITGSTVNGPSNSNVVSFPALSPLGDYTVTVHAAGYANATFDKTTTAVSCTDSSGVAHTGLRVWPGGVTSCVVTVNPLGSITLHTVGVTSDGNNSVVLASVPVSVQRLSGTTPTGPIFTGTTSATGDLVITGTNAAQGLLNGTWRVTASQNGYATKVGTVVIAPTTYAMTADTGSTALPIDSGVLQVRLTVNPVALQIHLTVNGVEALPAVTVSLAGGPTPLACTIKLTGTTYSCAETSNTGTVVNGSTPTGKYVNFATVSPSIYTVSVTSATSSYRTVTLQAQVVAGLTPQQLVLSLDERSSTQSGTMLLADSSHPAGITATLRTQQNIAVIAKDQNGQPLSVQTDSTGTYHFVGVPDGQYTLVGEYPGYAYAQFPTTVVMNSALTSTPPDLAPLQLTGRASGPVTLKITSTAKPVSGTAVSLTGASVVLTPPTAPKGLPADVVRTVAIPPGTGPEYDLVLSQLGTGTWKVQVMNQSDAPFAGVLAPDTVTVPQPPVTSGVIPTTPFPLAIGQSLVALQVQFANNSCLTAPTSLDLTLTKTGTTGSQTITAPVVAGATTSTATAKVYLPEGDYSFIPTVDAAMFGATATTFKVDSAGPEQLGGHPIAHGDADTEAVGARRLDDRRRRRHQCGRVCGHRRQRHQDHGHSQWLG